MLFIILGIWQIHRYEYKKALLAHYTLEMHSPPVSLQASSQTKDLQFKQIKVTGAYLNSMTAFLQNRYSHEHVGFDVLTPLRIAGNSKLLLVNRGWVPFLRDLKLPSIKPVNGNQTIIGYVKNLNEYVFMLGKNIVEPNKRPLVMQKVDINQLEKLTHKNYYPFVLRLNANQAHGFVRDWKPINVLPARHMGYVIQWFLMALVLLIAYFIFCSTPLSDEDDNETKK